jgi:hypothetical protein
MEGGRPSQLAAANDNNPYRFYVYAWCYPDGRPFYIGKGHGRRARDEFGRNAIFKRIVAKIRRGGAEPRIKKWHEGLAEGDAHNLEAAYVRLFGRRNIKTGILANMTDGGEGASGVVRSAEAIEGTASAHRGRKRSAETRAKISAANLGRKHTDAMRSAVSASKTGMPRPEWAKIKARMRVPIGIHKGVTFNKRRGKYCAAIWIDGKSVHIGRYLDADEAARAYDRVAYATWGASCYLNYPDDIVTYDGSSEFPR